jgi:hypothetical protein
MDSDNIISGEIAKKIFNIFNKEWNAVRKLEMKKHYPELINSTAFWIDFIQDKNLGITCIKSTIHSEDDEYKITDKNKWVLSKIKYAI